MLGAHRRHPQRPINLWQKRRNTSRKSLNEAKQDKLYHIIKNILDNLNTEMKKRLKPQSEMKTIYRIVTNDVNEGVTKTGNPGLEPFSSPLFLSFRIDKKAEKIRLARSTPSGHPPNYFFNQ